LCHTSHNGWNSTDPSDYNPKYQGPIWLSFFASNNTENAQKLNGVLTLIFTLYLNIGSSSEHLQNIVEQYLGYNAGIWTLHLGKRKWKCNVEDWPEWGSSQLVEQLLS
jgi:hypothetical protein